MRRELKDSVVVITGASSGIGRAAAEEFARRGAAVVLAARRGEVLESLAEHCRQQGAMALAVPTDVTDEAAVESLARQAIEKFGRIDVWVNNAAVTSFGRFEETTPEAFRRVVETNLFGYVHGARAVIPYFREQGCGVLINVTSVVSTLGQAYTSAYVASKFALRGFSECLRQELLDTDIRVCTLLPASIDTPLFQHGANYTGRAPQPMDPVYDARQVADAIVYLARRPRREMFVGRAGRVAALAHAVAPTLTERLVARTVERQHLQDLPTRPSDGNLFEPMPQWTGISGDWPVTGSGNGRGLKTLAGAGLLALPALAAWMWLRPGLHS